MRYFTTIKVIVERRNALESVNKRDFLHSVALFISQSLGAKRNEAKK